MTIAFFCEGNIRGKIPRDYPDMRTDLAWICALGADRIPLNQIPNKKYDLGIVIIPKQNPQFKLKNLENLIQK